MRYHVLVSVLLSVIASAPLHAQTVVEGRGGPLEVIGLRHWTLQQLEDSLARYSPGDSLRSHACAAALQARLGFPSAAVRTYKVAGGTEPDYVVVAFVEPQEAARVQRRVVTGPAGPELWPELRRAGGHDRFAPDRLTEAAQFLPIVRMLGPDSAARVLTRYFGDDVTRVTLALQDALAGPPSPAEHAQALRTLAEDGDVTNRALAALVLSRYPEADASWHALVAALRDSETKVGSAARAALAGMMARRTSPVDWTPAVDDLRQLLAGANLWGYPELLDALVKTGIDPALAAPLLRDNWHLALSYARARHPRSAEPARALLHALGGSADPDAWEPWLRGLDR